MRKNLLLTSVFGLLLFTFSACDKVKDALEKDVNIPTTVNFTINQLGVGAAETIGEFEVKYNLDSAVKANAPSLSADNVKSIKLKSFKIELIDENADNNFQAFKSIYASVSAQGLDTREVIRISDFNPANPTYSLTIPVTGGGIELKDYLSKKIKYSIKGETRKTFTGPIRARAKAEYEFTIGL
ncbi:hypothetical protein [Desertivirga xinjiangensis]|uniref:hypothetical protein n=1 Tax=Desertivirga xinjiangensis TaxID=539206 RepID=UPI00210C0C92|nr:hypothetical protein [Pedobacter xinjiangensis]